MQQLKISALIPSYAKPSTTENSISSTASSRATSSIPRITTTLTNLTQTTVALVISTSLAPSVLNPKSTVRELTSNDPITTKFLDLSSKTQQIFIRAPNVSVTQSTFVNKNSSNVTVSEAVSERIYFSAASQTKTAADRTIESVQSPSAASSTVAMIVGVTLAVILFVVLVVALVVYLRKRKQRLFEKNCSVVMTRMYPDITVNTNISFQKLS